MDVQELYAKNDKILMRQIKEDFFVEIGKLILKFIWISKAPRMLKTILKKVKDGGLILTKFQELL